MVCDKENGDTSLDTSIFCYRTYVYLKQMVKSICKRSAMSEIIFISMIPFTHPAQILQGQHGDVVLDFYHSFVRVYRKELTGLFPLLPYDNLKRQ